jgi:hypothetical protein
MSLKLFKTSCYSMWYAYQLLIFDYDLLMRLWLCFCHHSFWCSLNFPFWSLLWFAYDLHDFNLIYFMTYIFIHLICNLEYSWCQSWFQNLILNFMDENEHWFWTSWTTDYEILLICNYVLLNMQNKVLRMSNMKFIFIEEFSSWY